MKIIIQKLKATPETIRQILCGIMLLISYLSLLSLWIMKNKSTHNNNMYLGNMKTHLSVGERLYVYLG